MEQWPNLRGFIHDNQFVSDATALGISPELLDDMVSHDVEQVLRGMDNERLDDIYPCRNADLRLLLTEARPGVPPLRIAFRIAHEDSGKIQLCRCGLRG